MGAWLTIGKVAKQAGVNIQTLRYYERRGLLSPHHRKDSLFGENGYRLYSDETVKKIQFIKKAQELGFTLKEIIGLLRLRVSSAAKCGDVKRKAETKLRDVRAKVQSLKAMEKTLLNLVKTCRSQRTTGHCPILRSLEIQGKTGNPIGSK